MNIRKQSQSPRALIISLLVLALTVGIIFALEKSGLTNFINSHSDSKGPTKEEQAQEKQTNNELKQDFIENSIEPSPAPTPDSSDSVLVEAKQDGDVVTLLTKLYGFSGGNCVLKISNGENEYTKSAEVIYQPEFSSCAGFSVPVNQLGTGPWIITLDATPSGGSVLSQTITKQVN